MAWLDEEWTLSITDGDGRESMKRLLEHLADALRKKGIAVGHLKFLIQDETKAIKVSLTSLEQPGWLDSLPPIMGPQVKLLINGRVQMKADQLKSLVQTSMQSYKGPLKMRYSDAFSPGQPNPTHRYLQNT